MELRNRRDLQRDVLTKVRRRNALHSSLHDGIALQASSSRRDARVERRIWNGLAQVEKKRPNPVQQLCGCQSRFPVRG